MIVNKGGINLNNKKTSIVSRLMVYAGKYKIHMVLSWIFSAISGILTFGPYLCLFYVANELIAHGMDLTSLNKDILTYYGWFAVKLTGISFMFYGFALMFSHITAFNLMGNLKILLIDHMDRVPLGFHTTNSSGKLKKIIEKNSHDTENFVAHQMPDTVQAVVTPITFLIVSLYIDYRLTIACVIPIAVGFIALSKMMNNAENEFLTQYQTSLEEMSNASVEYVRGISVVKVFGQTVHSFKRFHDAIMNYKNFVIKYALSWKKPMGIYYTAIHGIFFTLIPAGIVIYQAVTGSKDFIVSFIFFIVLTPMVVTMLFRIMNCSSKKMIAEKSLDRIDEILKEKPMNTATLPKKNTGFDIKFKNVSFSYPGAATKVLENLSFEVKEGTVTALVGMSGGGKTTVANLIARFWDVDKGSVSIGGIDVRNLDYDEWLSNMSFVFQDVKLFKMSISENVAFDRPNASEEEIMRALHLAQCGDIIEKLPEGIHTIIGTKGVFISGGEMQRISIARAILKDAPVILLDEATSFADAENEYKIQQALNVLTKGKTVIMIAHRLSTITGADQILVIGNGKLIEKGTHLELLKKEKFYFNMYRQYQTGTSWKIGGEINA